MAKEYEIIGEIVDRRAFEQIDRLYRDLEKLKSLMTEVARQKLDSVAGFAKAGAGSSLDTQVDQLQRLNKEAQAFEKETAKLTKEQAKLEKIISQTSVAEHRFRETMRVASYEAKLNARILNAQEGSLEQLRAKLSKLTLQWDRMGAAMRASAPGRAVFDSMKSTREQIDELEKSTGRFQRNVGNYANSIRESFTGMATAVTAAVLSVGAVLSEFRKGITEELQAEGIRQAFASLNDPTLLDGLKKATGGMVSDVKLMQATIKAKDFGLPVEQLGVMFEFATRQARRTGESVDRLVESITTGLGRRSVQIIDNLGISSTQLREALGGVSVQAASVGELTAAVASIMRQKTEQMGADVESVGDRVQKMRVEWERIREHFVRALLPILASLLAVLVKVAKGLKMINPKALKAAFVLFIGVLGLFITRIIVLNAHLAILKARAVSVAIAKGAWALATKGLTEAQWLLNAAMRANPILGVISLITTLTGVIWGAVKAVQYFLGVTKEETEATREQTEASRANAAAIGEATQKKEAHAKAAQMVTKELERELALFKAQQEINNESLSDIANDTKKALGEREKAFKKHFSNLQEIRARERRVELRKLAQEQEEDQGKEYTDTTRKGAAYFARERQIIALKYQAQEIRDKKSHLKNLENLRREAIRAEQEATAAAAAVAKHNADVIAKEDMRGLDLRARIAKEISNREEEDYAQRAAAASAYADARGQYLEREYAAALQALQERTEKEKLTETARAAVLLNIESEYQQKRAALAKETAETLKKIESDSETKQKEAAAQALANKISTIERAGLEKIKELRESFAKKEHSDLKERARAWEETQKAIEKVTKESQQKITEATISGLSKMLETEKLTQAERLRLLQELEAARKKAQAAEEAQMMSSQKKGAAVREWAQAAELQALDITSAAIAAHYDFKNQRIDAEKNKLADAEMERQAGMQAEIERIQALEIAESDKADMITQLRAQDEQERAEYARKQKQLDIQKAENEKKAAIFRVILDTARGVMGIWGTHGANPIMAGILTAGLVALAGIQLAKIARQPVPRFAKGTASAPEGLAIVGEQGAELIHDARGFSYLSPGRPTLTYLSKGSQVITARETRTLISMASPLQPENNGGGMVVNLHDTNELLRAIKDKKTQIHIHLNKGAASYLTR